MLPGSAMNYNTYYTASTLAKTDAFGNIQWAKKYSSGTYNSYMGGASSGIQTTDGGYLLATSATDSINFYSAYQIIKTDAQGNVQWSNNYSSANMPYAWLTSYHILPVSGTGPGYVFLGQAMDMNFDGWFHLFKISSSGNLVWSKVFSRNNKSEVYDAAQLNEGGFVMVGEMIDSLSNGENLAVIKTDANGNLLWSKIYDWAGFGSSGSTYAVSETSDQGLVITGGNGQMLLMKLSSSGTVQWAKTFSSPGGGQCINVLPNDQLLVSGGYAPRFLIKTDNTGNLLWAKSYPGTPYYLSMTSVNSDGGFVFSGTDSNNGLTTFFRTDASGTGCDDGPLTVFTSAAYPTVYPNNCASSIGMNVTPVTISVENLIHTELTICTVGIEEQLQQNGWAVYPNPFNSQTVFRFDEEQKNAQLMLYDVAGRELRAVSFSGRELILERGNLADGIYFFKVTAGEKNVATGKLVVQ